MKCFSERLWLAGALVLLVGFAYAGVASAQVTACAAKDRTGFDPNPGCATNCCLTVVPWENDLNVGSGLCVDSGLCEANPTENVVACSSGEAPLAIGPDPTCKDWNCCLTIIPGTSGLCVPPDFCGGP